MSIIEWTRYTRMINVIIMMYTKAAFAFGSNPFLRRRKSQIIVLVFSIDSCSSSKETRWYRKKEGQNWTNLCYASSVFSLVPSRKCYSTLTIENKCYFDKAHSTSQFVRIHAVNAIGKNIEMTMENAKKDATILYLHARTLSLFYSMDPLQWSSWHLQTFFSTRLHH